MLTVFYAWQSDRANATNRGFIQRALEDAVSKIKADFHVYEPLELDHDTKNTPGLPVIADTIFEKINQCTVFVGDVTFSATSEKGKMLPNPNVLIELGYALAACDDRRIVLVMNTHHGAPENLPFDLCHRRFPIQYSLAEDAAQEDKQKTRNELTRDLRKAIQAILTADARGEMEDEVTQDTAKGDAATYFGGRRSESILEEGSKRYQSRATDHVADAPSHGGFEVALTFDGVYDFHPDTNFLDLVTRANPARDEDWPFWFNYRTSLDPSTRPKVIGGCWETWLALLAKERWRAPSVDFWVAWPLGRFYHRRGYWEDGLWPGIGHQPYPVHRAFDISLHLRFITAALLTGQSFARAMGVTATDPHLDFTFRWTNLRDRTLVSSVHQLLFLQAHKAADDVTTSSCYLPLAADKAKFTEVLVEAIRPLANTFSGFAIPNQWVQQEAHPILEGRRQ